MAPQPDDGNLFLHAARGYASAGLRRFLPALAALVIAGLSSTARATETQWWILDTPADYARSESRGVVVRPDGVLQLGPATASSVDDSLTTVWSIAVLKDGSVALAGDRGRIDRWTESGGIRPWVRLPVGQVMALAADGDGVVAGTAPDGVIYRIGAKGDTTVLARTGERYVWALAPGARSVWYAATGTRGKLFRIEGKNSRVVLDSDESNLVSLLSDGAGGVYTGGDSKGRVIQVRANGSVRTVFDAPEDEVRALALGADHALYAAALSASAVATEDESEREGERPAPVRSAVSGSKATVYRIVPDSSAVGWWASPQPFVFALAAMPGGIVAATGNRAGVYQLGRTGEATQWLAAPQGQVTALATDARGRLFAATSNPVVLWRMGPAPATEGELQSGVLDARRIARFGRIRWQGHSGGKVAFATRSGNTDPPDTTWSEWQGGSVGTDGARITSPAGRYLQWKATLSGKETAIESVEASWREQNLPPQLENLVIAPQGQSFREGEMQPRTEPVTQTLPGGQKVEYSIPPSATNRQLRDLPMWARGMRTVQWKASDPNGDPLTFKVETRSGDGSWIELGDDLDATAFTWDTNALPDGRYRLRVTATDREGNAVGEERGAELLSEPFTIDNTPPQVSALEAKSSAGGVDVQARAGDGMSTLTRMEVAVDDDDWRTVTPVSGFADERELAIRAHLPKIKPGEHTVSVRAVDFAGNAATRAVRVTVPAGR